MTWVNQSDSTLQGSSSQAANTFLGGPVSGGAIAPVYRALVAADIPATWTTPTFAAGNFTASGAMTWTVAAGNVNVYQYMVLGKTMTITFNISGTTVGGVAATTLQLAIPGGFLAAKAFSPSTFSYSDAGTAGVGQVDTGTAAGSSTLRLLKNNLAINWTVGAGTNVAGQITFEVQ